MVEENALELRDISKSFPGVKALSNVTFICRKGEVHGLVGENGAGKSTLIKVLSGAHLPDEGEVILQGKSVSIRSPHDAFGLGIGVIYQEFTLVPYLSAVENIFLGHERTTGGFVKFGKMLKDAEALVYDTLGIRFDLTCPVAYLSVAQRQMVEIAKALALDAEILVMDEPSAPLTSHELDSLFQVIEALRDKGVTIIYISHRLEEIFRIANRVTVLKDGQVVGTHDVGSLGKEALIEMMVGRDLSKHYFADRGSGPGRKVLSVSNLSTADGLQDISFEVYEKEIVGIAGLVGSGRSELMRAIFGADQRTSGDIEIDGEVARIRRPKHAVDYGIGFVPEDRKVDGLCLPLQLRVNATLASLSSVSTAGVLKLAVEKDIVQSQVDRLRVVTPSLEQIVANLSGGNQQKVVLAKWLAAGVKILILDEPTRGIDVGAKAEIYRLMRELAESGAAVIMVSSELPEILGMSDRILVMREGRLVAELSPDNATEHSILTCAMGETQ
jgi:ribose transport system ATP-binding protein